LSWNLRCSIFSFVVTKQKICFRNFSITYMAL
jgi:hypothetical protein